jgi:hypothetical protein
MESDLSVDKFEISQKHSTVMNDLMNSLEDLIQLKITNEVTQGESKTVIFCRDFLPQSNLHPLYDKYFNKLSLRRIGEVYDKVRCLLEENSHQFADFGDYSFIINLPNEN